MASSLAHGTPTFHKNRASSFSVILQTNKQTNGTENMTSLAEVIIRLFHKMLNCLLMSSLLYTVGPSFSSHNLETHIFVQVKYNNCSTFTAHSHDYARSLWLKVIGNPLVFLS